MATWNELMEQRVVELEQKVGGFGGRFDAIDQRFDAMDQRFDAIDQRLDSMDRKIEELPTKDDLRAFMEGMASRIQIAAEGYGATLEALRRDIKRNSTRIRTKDRDRDLVLKDHAKRIRALEQRSPT